MSLYCNHTLLSRQYVGRIPVFFYWRDQISIWSIACQMQSIFFLWENWHHLLSMRYCNQCLWTGLIISKASYLMRRWHYFALKTLTKFQLSSHRGQCLLLQLNQAGGFTRSYWSSEQSELIINTGRYLFLAFSLNVKSFSYST